MSSKLKKPKGMTFFLSLLLILSCTHQKNTPESNQETSTTTTSGFQNNVLRHDGVNVSVVYNSADGGVTWIPYDDGIPDDATVSSFLVMNDMILAATDYHGIYLIMEGESKWKRIDEDLPENVDINAIVNIENILVIGTISHGILISENNGKNWSYPSVQIKNVQVRCLHRKDTILFAGTDKGIYTSADYGKAWEHIYKGVQVNGFTELNSKVYAALMNGAIMSDDNGLSWKYVYGPHTLHDISNDGERLYAMTLGDGLKVSVNDGLTWESINRGLGTYNLYTFELKKFSNSIFAAQWIGIYRSDNRGMTWNLIKSGLPDSTAFTTLETTKSGLIAGIGLRKK
jgi:hypothetical protein